MRIDLIVNVQARQYVRRPSLLDRVRRSVAGRARLHVTHDLVELDQVAAHLSASGTELCMLSGGDGTLMAGVTALCRSFGEERLPPIAPIPGGTVGTVARNWGVHGDPVACVERVLAAPRSLTRRPSLRVIAELGAAEGSEQRIGFIMGTGLVARFFQLYYERGAPGYGGSARIVARVFVESFVGGPFARRVLDPLPCTLRADGRELAPRAWSLVCASVVPNLGIHMLVNYRAGELPGRVHLVASPLSARHLGPRAPFVLTGRRIGGPDHFDELVTRFSLAFPSTGPYVLDGELLEAARVVVTPGPSLAMATPSP